MDTKTARGRLEAALRDIETEEATLRGENAHESSELSSYDQHPADTASQVSEADREDALLEALAQRRVEVEEALGRIASGDYGRCVDCGQELPAERLEARPEAARCVSCQSRLEGAA